MDTLLITELDLASVVTVFTLNHTSSSVSSYLSALQHFFDLHGAGYLSKGPGFALFLSGLRLIFGPADVVVRRSALSLPDFHTLVSSLDPTSPADICFAAELIVAFFLCLRTEDHTTGPRLIH